MVQVAYEALKFRPWIEEMAEALVKKIGQEGPYMALHLRLEKDVWVRTGCHSGLGKEADLVIENERAAKPQLLTSRKKLTALDRYAAGLCPLNANEISRCILFFSKTKIWLHLIWLFLILKEETLVCCMRNVNVVVVASPLTRNVGRIVDHTQRKTFKNWEMMIKLKE